MWVFASLAALGVSAVALGWWLAWRRGHEAGALMVMRIPGVLDRVKQYRWELEREAQRLEAKRVLARRAEQEGEG